MWPVRRRAQRAANAGAAADAEPAVAGAPTAVVVMVVAAGAAAAAAGTNVADEVGDMCWQRGNLLHDGEGGPAAWRLRRSCPPRARRDDRTGEQTVIVEIATGGGREGACDTGRGLLVGG